MFCIRFHLFQKKLRENSQFVITKQKWVGICFPLVVFYIPNYTTLLSALQKTKELKLNINQDH